MDDLHRAGFVVLTFREAGQPLRLKRAQISAYWSDGEGVTVMILNHAMPFVVAESLSEVDAQISETLPPPRTREEVEP